MRGAGLIVPNVGPLERWHQEWAQTGVCSVNGPLTQHLLSSAPLLHTVRGDVLAPRPDAAPPRNLTPGSLVVYLGSAMARRCAAWGYVVVVAGRDRHDGGSVLVSEAAGPLLVSPSDTPWEGATAHLLSTASIVAAIEALHALNSTHPSSPILFRAPGEMAAAVAGLGTSRDDAVYCRLRRMIASSQRHVWLTGARLLAAHPWADRAYAIARICTGGGVWGGHSARWARHPRQPAPRIDMTCAVCTDDFSDALPSPSLSARAPAGLFDCDHAVCRGCDWDLQRRGIDRCPLCRQPRVSLIRPFRP